MERAQLTGEEGFGLIELLIAMVVMQIALLAIIGAFGASAVGLARASRLNTAAVLADTQIELYRAMPYDAIGLDTAGAPTTGTYVSDTSFCPSGQTPVCGNTAPRNNAGGGSWSCTATSGTTAVSVYFSANGINPCVAHRLVSSTTQPPSPDKQTYYVDTYVSWAAPVTASRAVKQVSVVVRNSTNGRALASQVSTFDCSTGNPLGAAPCL
ncbi:MAG: type II secretion system protein [Thermoleophilia bacterium]|nr:type II secretion system protein [Thermoleophilia bacterium]